MLGPLTATPPRPARGFTLVELLIVIAVAGVLVTLAAPSLRDFILLQRLKSVNAQLVTDLQYARSEAVARNQYARLIFLRNETLSCYVIFTSPANSTRCDCRLAPGSRCASPMQEIRTVQLLESDSVRVGPQLGIGQSAAFAFDHVSGGIVTIPSDDFSTPLNEYRIHASIIGSARGLITAVGRAGRSTVCSPDGQIAGVPAC